MPDSAPEGYKKLAEQCCDADLDKHPKDVVKLWYNIDSLIKEGVKKGNSDDNILLRSAL